MGRNLEGGVVLWLAVELQTMHGFKFRNPALSELVLDNPESSFIKLCKKSVETMGPSVGAFCPRREDLWIYFGFWK